LDAAAARVAAAEEEEEEEIQTNDMTFEKIRVIERNKKEEETEEEKALKLMKINYKAIDSQLDEIKNRSVEVASIYYYTLEQIKIKKRIYELGLELKQMEDSTSILSINLTGNVPFGTKEIQNKLIDYITKNINEYGNEIDYFYNDLFTIFDLIRNYFSTYNIIEANLEQLEALVHLCGIILKEHYIITITECMKSKYHKDTQNLSTPFFDFVIPFMLNYKLEYSDQLYDLLTDDYSDYKQTKQLLRNLLFVQIHIINMKKNLYKCLKYHQYKPDNYHQYKPDIFIPLTEEQILQTIANLNSGKRGTTFAKHIPNNNAGRESTSTRRTTSSLAAKKAAKGGANKTRKKSKSSQLRKTLKKRRVKKIKRKSLRRRKPIKKRVNSKNRKVKRKIKNKTRKYKKPKKQKRSRKPKHKP